MSRARSLAAGALLAVVTLAVSVASCVAPTDTTIALVSVRGTWSYVSNENGRAASSTGTMTLSQDSTVRFSGSLEANEMDDRGQLRRVVAIVSGRTIDASLIDFDVVLDPSSTRRHSGSVHGDSLTGNWIEASSTGVVAAGTFRAHRTRSQ